MGKAVDPELTSSERRAEVVDLYRQGLTFQVIGDQLGFSRQRAHQLYWEAMRAVVEEAVSAHRAAMVEEIAEIIRVASQVMHGQHYAHSNGRVVTDPHTDKPLLDDGPKLDAARTIIAAQARLAKVLGADAATKVESDVSLKYEVVGVEVSDLV
ncbi:MAG TPA: helix-turn-helix domain-containing protein [Pseudonocardiaceae bacterium]|nr:helix-turn-helix domain-containing protein [Pseudonocardiaceae bacterium]